MTKPITKDKALIICKQVRSDNAKKLLTLDRWQCWGCVTFSMGDPAKMCFSGGDGNRGCSLINNIFDKG